MSRLVGSFAVFLSTSQGHLGHLAGKKETTETEDEKEQINDSAVVLCRTSHFHSSHFFQTYLLFLLALFLIDNCKLNSWTLSRNGHRCP